MDTKESVLLPNWVAGQLLPADDAAEACAATCNQAHTSCCPDATYVIGQGLEMELHISNAALYFNNSLWMPTYFCKM